MKSLLTAILCLAAVATTRAAETPGQFAGRWAGIAEFGQSKNPDLNGSRALLTFEVNPDGSITNGTIRDFAGYALSSFGGQLDAHGRLTSAVMPGPGPFIPELQINLGRTTGTGTYRDRPYDLWNYRSTIRLWREEKPTRNNGETHGVTVEYLDPVGFMPTNIVVLTPPPAPPASNP